MHALENSLLFTIENILKIVRKIFASLNYYSDICSVESVEVFTTLRILKPTYHESYI